MKLKFMLVPLAVVGLAIGCSKNEICNKSESKAKELTWVTPNDKICKANGGKIDKDGICKAPWTEAKDICRAGGGRLADRCELKQVIVDCGGIVNSLKNNVADSDYESCYKRRGFSSTNYWSSTTYAKSSNLAWIVGFSYGYVGFNPKGARNHVRCVRAGE